ncbi:MAG: flagellar hook-associated protein 3 [Firmicutes bacterium]|nr:flagellar hook-associated protein 3 [Bacillota bacterium]
MIADNTLRNINKAANRLAAANAAVSSNQKIQKASDDPVVAARAVTYRSYVSQIKQYQDNTDAADGWQTATDDALSDLNDVITTVKTLTTEAASDTCSADDLTDIQSRVSTLLDEAVSIMNTTYNGRYIFGGYSTSEAPYSLETTDLGETVTYKGDYLSLGGVISTDVSDADITAFYTANTGSVYDSLSDAAAGGQTAYDAAAAASVAFPSDTSLAAKAAAALDTLNTLNTAVTTYGGSLNLSDAITAAEADYETITAAVTTYGGTTTLTDAATAALSAYTTAQAAADVDPADTDLADAATAAKTVSDTLATAVTMYGGTTALEDAATEVKNTVDTLTAAGGNAAQNINYNIGFNSEVTVNIEGQDVVGEGSGSNLFNTFAKLLLALNGDTSYKSAGMDSAGNVTLTTNSLDLSDLIDEFSANLDQVTVAQATLGARMDVVGTASTNLDDAYTTYSTFMTDNEDIDTATAATELASAEYTYEAALSVGAKVISKTLIDYIG